MPSQSNKIIFGAAVLGNPDAFAELKTQEDEQRLLDLLKSSGVTNLDTAQLYGNGTSESTIGKLKAIEQGFTVDTKWIGGWTGKSWATHETVVSSAKDSLEKLGAGSGKEVDIFYIHSPDLHTPFAETLKGVNDAFQAGGFKRFGLSNFSPAQVKEVIEITKKEGYVQPTVYQGSYSAVARKAEDELFPLLRQHGIAFYAYSPIAGGFLTKNRKFIEEQQGRFSKDAIFGIYHTMYHKENFMKLLDDWERIATEEGVSKAELAFRWINYHSALKPELGDGVIFGASKFKQAEDTPKYLKNGPLSEGAAKQIHALWATVKDDSIMDNFVAVFGGGA